MKEIPKLMDKFFKDVFKRDNNAATLLKKLLPDEIRSRVDFSTLKPGSTNYISKTYDEFFSDIVFNAEMTGKAGKSGKPITTDICFILEHKTKAGTKDICAVS
ncbi:MAG: Rpn family recombination-promoting nuclease/putative transposase [bacterium]|nr:Rpn family recombination-promoting nuclease/putative transposase [bacterium]